jgi:hypothetical protein
MVGLYIEHERQSLRIRDNRKEPVFVGLLVKLGLLSYFEYAETRSRHTWSAARPR